MAEEKKYWLGLEDLQGQDMEDEKEFPEALPVLKNIAEPISKKSTGRRDFLKMLGFSVTAAAVAASCEMPVRKSIPYTIKPEEITPGIPNYYATAFISRGNYSNVLVKTREGRPIMLEGNKQSSISQGGVQSRLYGALLNLYDNARIKHPLKNGQKATWEEVDKDIMSQLTDIVEKEGKIALLSSTVISPSLQKTIEAFQTAYPNTNWVTYDPISSSGMLEANEENFGRRVLPEYHFDKADLIVSVGADFLGTWVSPTEYAADYATRRKVTKENTNMNRHIQIESIPTLSGSSADVRIPVKPSQEDIAVLHLYNAIASKTGQFPSVSTSAFPVEGIEAVADELLHVQGTSLVVCGSARKETQILVNAINEMLGNYGNTVDITQACYYRQGVDKEVYQLVQEMNGGNVDALFIVDMNPAYVLGEAFVSGLEKVGLTVDFSERQTETTSLVQYVCPNHHWLESWNDAMPKDGVYATSQPTISPLFDTRQIQETLLTWSGNPSSSYDYIRTYCRENIFPIQSKYSTFEALWTNLVHDGEILVDRISVDADVVSSFGDFSLLAAVITSSSSVDGDIELKLYEKPQIGDGTYSDNPWMQELADPITRITWDNYIVANPKWVESNGLLHNHKNKNYQVASIVINDVSVTLPVVALPGVPDGVMGIAYGYGRTNTAHKVLENGVNAYSFRTYENGVFGAASAVQSWSKTGEVYQLGIIQQHHRITHKGLGGEKTRLVVKETTLDQYKADPWAGNVITDGGDYQVRRDKWVDKHMNSLYGEETPENPDSQAYGGAHVDALSNGHHWGMAIDLNSCIGCGSCVIACNAENNIPVVGKDEVRRAHEMNWLRIDKYYTGDEDNPDVVFQPMMCQHCDNAPCENVCPVAATPHSSEGLNMMTYNRCIGTRYCANNCPYKVRRFNWYDYTGSDSFSSNKGFILDNDFDGSLNLEALGIQGEGKLGLHDPLARMVLNPDVTVRGRGVMEKCSFCIQRTQLGKLEAKKANRPLRDGDIQTACQSACPTQAITFGDTNAKESAVSKMWADERAFGVIEETHTLPSVMYMVKVRNRKENHVSSSTNDHT